MEHKLDAILGAVWIILVLEVINLFNTAFARDGVNLFTVIQNMRNYTRRTYALASKIVKPKLKLRKRGNVEPSPEIDEAEFRRFCRELLAEVRESDDIASVPVTEAYWKSKGWGREQFVAFRERLEKAGIIRVVDDRGKRGWMQTPKGYAGAVKRLEDLTK